MPGIGREHESENQGWPACKTDERAVERDEGRPSGPGKGACGIEVVEVLGEASCEDVGVSDMVDRHETAKRTGKCLRQSQADDE